MRMSGKKIGLISFIVLLIIFAGYLATPFVLSALIERRIIATIEKLKNDGIIVHYDSLYALPDKIVLDHLDVIVHSNDAYCARADSHASIETVKITGLELLPILFYHTLNVDSVILTKPSILHSDIKPRKGERKKQKKKLQKISVSHAMIKQASFEITDTATCKSSFSASFNGEIGELAITNLDQDSVIWFSSSAMISGLDMKLHDTTYTISVKEVAYSMEKKNFHIDSVRIIPVDKYTFAKKMKYQADRVEGYIPFINGKGFEIISDKRALFRANTIDLRFHLDVFRDRHYPFKRKSKSLPVKFLHSLPIYLQVDTVRIDKSFVSYEELQDDENKSGKVFFDDIKCKIKNVSNHSSKKTTMETTARFMDDGYLKGSFTFPTSPEKAYTVEGVLTNFTLPKVNSMLTTAGRAKVETGKLDEMKFHFVYNDTRADGKLELNYSNLKMTSLANHKRRINKFITFLLRLVLRRDMHDNLPTNQKTGDIHFYRDKQRSIFNYWWKSILSGIKSVYNLDKFKTPEKKK
jgi:hypothetical protein